LVAPVPALPCRRCRSLGTVRDFSAVGELHDADQHVCESAFARRSHLHWCNERDASGPPVGWDKATLGARPGAGSGNEIQLYDRQTGRLSTLLPGALSTQRGVIWPRFNADGTKIAWAQMVKAPEEVNFPWGDWELHVAEVDLATGKLTNNRAWRDAADGYAMIEAYGWIPGTNRIIFQSTTRATSPGFQAAQLWTLPDNLDPNQSPTRISPKMAPPLELAAANGRLS
jgi:hypothetical protein